MTGSLWHLAAAMALFLASHAVTATPRLRGALVSRLGEAGYFLAYSLLSLAVLAWLVQAYAAAPYVPLWPQAPWTRWVPAAVMPAASLLLAAGFTTPNPFSLGPGGRRYDPARPGILRLTRHPVLWALALWAGAHLFPNGTLSAVFLFGPLLLLALAGPRLLDVKRRRSLGAGWHALARLTARPATLSLAEIGWRRLAGGLILYLILIFLHPLIIGFSPLPF
ncbi:MAG: NnrU family protein [Rhodospirillales bacterium]|nr:NnrU family protein [Rhodospirillales bacterium]